MNRRNFLALLGLGVSSCNDDFENMDVKKLNWWNNSNGTVSYPQGSFLYDSVGDYFVSSAASLLDSEISGSNKKFSISIWCKRNTSTTNTGVTIGGYQTIFSRDNNSGGRQFALEFRGAPGVDGGNGMGRFSFYIFTDASNYSFWETTYPLYSTNNWYNLIVTYDGSQSLANKCKIYVNGVDEILTRIDIGTGVTTTTKSTPTEPLYIGVTNFGGLVNPFSGYVGRICFWTDIISSADATAIWNNGVDVNERLLTLSKSIYMQFDPAQSTFSSNWTMGDSVGTSYGVSKNFVSTGLVEADFKNDKYPSINLNTNTNTLISYMSVAPSLKDKYLIDSFIQNSIDDGNWAELDDIWFFAAHDQQAARLRWKNPTSTAITEVSSPVWTSNIGYTGDGSADYLNTNFNLSTATKFTLNSASIGCYLVDNKNEQSAAFGIITTPGTLLVPRNAGGFGARINTASTTMANTLASSVGFWSLIRTASNAQSLRRNNVEIGSNTAASSSIPSGDVYLLNYNNAGSPGVGFYSTNRISCFYVGSSAIDQTKLYNRVTEFLAGKGL